MQTPEEIAIENVKVEIEGLVERINDMKEPVMDAAATVKEFNRVFYELTDAVTAMDDLLRP